MRRIGQNDLGAQEAHELSALDRKALRHDTHVWVSLGGADHGEADARVAA